MRLTARVLSVSLAVVGLVVLLTDWIDWPWWAGLGLCLPFGLLFLLDDDFRDFVDSDSSGSGEFGGNGGGGGGNGG